ncbi:hypothetical protein EJB05_29288, partial [Eragrostis curvula]
MAILAVVEVVTEPRLSLSENNNHRGSVITQKPDYIHSNKNHKASFGNLVPRGDPGPFPGKPARGEGKSGKSARAFGSPWRGEAAAGVWPASPGEEPSLLDTGRRIPSSSLARADTLADLVAATTLPPSAMALPLRSCADLAEAAGSLVDRSFSVLSASSPATASATTSKTIRWETRKGRRNVVVHDVEELQDPLDLQGCGMSVTLPNMRLDSASGPVQRRF